MSQIKETLKTSGLIILALITIPAIVVVVGVLVGLFFVIPIAMIISVMKLLLL